MEKGKLGEWSFPLAAVYLIKKTPDLVLTSKELIETILKNGMVKTKGKTPEKTMNSGLLRQLKKGDRNYLGIVKRNGKFYYEPTKPAKNKEPQNKPIENESEDEIEI